MTSCGNVWLPERLRHLAPLLVEREAVRQHDVERRAPSRAAAFQQGGLEPASMLVRAFEIHHLVGTAVDGRPDSRKPGKMDRILQHEGVGRAGIEPDFDQIVDLLIVLGLVLVAEETPLGARREPRVGAFLLEGRRRSGR